MAAVAPGTGNDPRVGPKVHPFQNGILTPEGTPAVDDERIAADDTRRAEQQRNHDQGAAAAAAAAAANDNDNRDDDSDDDEDLRDDLSEEGKKAVDHIMGCNVDEFAKMVGVGEDAPEETKLSAFGRLGRMIHAKLFKDTDKAFKKLRKAAEKAGISPDDIEEMKSWKGEDKLSFEDEEDEKEDEDMKDDTEPVPQPPKRVEDIYQEANDLFARLKIDPADLHVIAAMKKLNEKITEGNLKDGRQANEWHINIVAISTQYQWSVQFFMQLLEDASNKEAKKTLHGIRSSLASLIEANHYPAQWNIPTAEEFLQHINASRAAEVKEKVENMASLARATHSLFDKADTYMKAFVKKKGELGVVDEAIKKKLEDTESTIRAEVAKARAADEMATAEAEKAANSTNLGQINATLEVIKTALATATEVLEAISKAVKEAEEAIKTRPNTQARTNTQASRIAYPWVTGRARDGSTIVGYRRQGPFGFQAHLDDGSTNHLVSAYEAGFPEVEDYIKQIGAKNLAENQSSWSIRDRIDFVEILAVADGTNGTDCVCKFATRGIDVLTGTSLAKVLGLNKAKSKIHDFRVAHNMSDPPPRIRTGKRSLRGNGDDSPHAATMPAPRSTSPSRAEFDEIKQRVQNLENGTKSIAEMLAKIAQKIGVE